MTESVLRVQPRTKSLIDFWWGAGRPSRKLESGHQIGQVKPKTSRLLYGSLTRHSTAMAVQSSILFSDCCDIIL